MNDVPGPTVGEAPRQRARWILAAIGGALILVIAVRLLAPKPARRAPPPQVVKVARVVRGDLPETLSELGTVTPIDTVNVLSQLSGYLTAVGYREGGEVRAGQFLAQIDPRPYENGLHQAEAQLEKDQAALELSRTDLGRYLALSAQHAIAEQTVADARFTVKQQRAQVALDAANVAQYRLDLQYAHITAPIAGRVGLRLVDPGNYVTASSSPGIAVITSMKPTTVVFSVAQNDLAKVLARFRSGAKLPVSAYTNDQDHPAATGVLYAIGNQMATGTGTVPLRARFANQDEALFPNEFVTVRMLVDTLRNALVVPTPAVLSGAPGDYVYLVAADRTVKVRKVTVGPSDGLRTAILSGLSAGDRVVVDGTDRLTDGAKIRVASTAE